MNNLQLPQKDREKEIDCLESFIKSDIDARELKRAIADPMALSGNIYHEISKILGVIPIHYEGTLKYRVKVEYIQYGEQTSGTNPGNG